MLLSEDPAGGAVQLPHPIRLRTSPGDYIFVPRTCTTARRTPDPAEEVVVVIARSTQEAIVVNSRTCTSWGGEEGAGVPG